jgi:hypothetical protein
MSIPFEHAKVSDYQPSQTALYESVKRYIRHLGPEAHAILGNLKWIYYLDDPLLRKNFDAYDLRDAFVWSRTPQGEAYWFRIDKIVHEGRSLRRDERVSKLKATLTNKSQGTNHECIHKQA